MTGGEPPDLLLAEDAELTSAAVIGDGSPSILAVAPTLAISVLSSAMDRIAAPSAQYTAAQVLLGIALHARWLHERDYGDFAAAVGHLQRAQAAARNPTLRDRIAGILGAALFNRYQLFGDHADLGAAIAYFDLILGTADAKPSGAAPSGPVGWGDLITILVAADDPAQPIGIRELLISRPPTRKTGGLISRRPASSAFRAETQAAAGAAYLLAGLSGRTRPAAGQRPGQPDPLQTAEQHLRKAQDTLAPDHPRHPALYSDLALLDLARAEAPDSPGGGQRRPELAAALDKVIAAAESCPASHPHYPALVVRAAGALHRYAGARLAATTPRQRLDLVDRGITLLNGALTTAGYGFSGERSRCEYALGRLRLVRFELAGDPADLAVARTGLSRALVSLDRSPGDPFAATAQRALAATYRAAGRADTSRRLLSRSVARSVLYAHARSVLLQSGTRRGMDAARQAGTDMLRLFDWCIADGALESAVEALELGRGLVLHAATVVADVAALLASESHVDLAQEWSSQTRQATPADRDTRHSQDRAELPEIPGDLRLRVLRALERTPAERRLLSAPKVTDIAAALRSSGLDALVYLIPGTSHTGGPGDLAGAGPALRSGRSGRALLVTAAATVVELHLPDLRTAPDGAFHRYTRAHQDLRGCTDQDLGYLPARQLWNHALGELCDWAWTAAIGPVLHNSEAWNLHQPPRLVLAPVGDLGAVPWHAARLASAGSSARHPRYRYACEDAVFSSCASARQLIDVAARTQLPLSQSPVFVADPTDDLAWAIVEARRVRSAHYPDARYLGVPLSEASGRGEPGEVLPCLPSAAGDGASMLHLACHARAEDSSDRSFLVLADNQPLYIDDVLRQAGGRPPAEPGGLVVLAACETDLAVGDYDEALTLATSFLAAGATGVIGSRWQVQDARTALLMFMFHHYLVADAGRSPADALRAAQLWMLDPDRVIPGKMPDKLAKEIRRQLTDPIAWAGFSAYGR